ncbi:hypothetical protein FSARC_11436 [Fusarium sarcochroum]|uniref:Uncharacterized protein n=1 Tax=Fusarium sarcochroum TaxID=1208366 RepID=A0A8H4TFH8_9HYPO|nr:hypothetical protein FSARC_11436 [Fusarium sarcochroum]
MASQAQQHCALTSQPKYPARTETKPPLRQGELQQGELRPGEKSVAEKPAIDSGGNGLQSLIDSIESGENILEILLDQSIDITKDIIERDIVKTHAVHGCHRVGHDETEMKPLMMIDDRWVFRG